MTRAAPRIEAVSGFARRVAHEPWQVVAAVTSIAFAVVAVRALAGGVQLIDERALFELRARDVLTADHPLLGTRSSAGEFNHPGPLLFDLLSVPVRLLGGPAGVTFTIVAVNIAMVWLSGAAARRLGGGDLALTVTVAITMLGWTLGSDLLIDPWPANSLVVPFFALLVLTAAVVAGDHRWLPLVVAIASLCAQAQLSYLLLAPALIVVATIAVAVRVKHQPSRASRRPLVQGAVIAFIAWAQPLWQQLFGSGPGNLSKIFAAGRTVEDRTGWRLGTRLLASVVAKPPAWWRPSYDSDESLAWIGAGGQLVGSTRLLSFGAALGVIAVLGVVGSWCVRSNARTCFKGARSMVLVGAVAAAVALVTASIVPLDPFGASAYKVRYLWSIGAFISATFAACALHAVRAFTAPGRSELSVRWVEPGRWATPAIIVVAAAFAFLVVPTRTQSEGEFTRRDVWPVMAAVRSQLSASEQAGTVLVETQHVPFPDYFSWPIMTELDRQGIEFVVDTSDAARQVGLRRRDTGRADVRLYLVFGDWATATFAGTRRIAYADGGHDGLEVGVFVAERVTPAQPTTPDGCGRALADPCPTAHYGLDLMTLRPTPG